MLSEAGILARLPPGLASRMAAFALHDTVDSTNERLLESSVPRQQFGVCIAQAKTAGRGRQGRSWQTPAGSGLCLSVATTLAAMPPAGITLAAGVVVHNVLGAAGAQVELKWPNDLVARGGKLGGLLAETRSEKTGVRLVVGLGLNLSLPADFCLPEADAVAPTDLAAAGAAAVDADALAAELVAALATLLLALPAFDAQAYAREFARHDALAGRPIAFTHNGEIREGTAQGVTPAGALMVATDQGVEHLQSGEVRVRSSP